MTVNGKRKIIEGQGKTKEAAIQARSEAITRAMTGTTRKPQTIVRAGTMTAEMTEWNEKRDVKQRTREHTRSIIKNHIMTAAIGSRSINSITTQEYKALITDDSKTKWTQRQIYKNLRSFMAYATENKIISKNPADDPSIKPPKNPRAKHANPVDMANAIKRQNALLKWMERTRWMDDHPMYWARIQVALCGLRPGEGRGLTWDEIENPGDNRAQLRIEHVMASQAGGIAIAPVKNNNPRIVAITDEARDALKAWKKIQNGYKRRKTWNPRFPPRSRAR